MKQPAKNTVCLWSDRDAEEAARFKEGDVLLVGFTVMGIPCVGLNGGPEFKHNEAFSFQVATADQAETDRYCSAGTESELNGRFRNHRTTIV